MRCSGMIACGSDRLLEQIRHSSRLFASADGATSLLAPGVEQLWWIDPEKIAAISRKRCAIRSVKLEVGPTRTTTGKTTPRRIQSRSETIAAQGTMTGYFVRRFLLIIPTFIGITMAVFLIMNFVPGGPVERQIMRYKMAVAQRGGGAARGNVDIPQEAIDEMKHYYGFDKPVYTRYGLWLWNVLHLNLGRSYIYQDPVWDVIKSRFPISLFLGLDGIFPELPGVHPAGRVQGHSAWVPLRSLQQPCRVSRLLDSGLGAGDGAAGAFWRRKFLEYVPARRFPSARLGIPRLF